MFASEIAVYPGSAQDLGVLLGLPQVKTFVFINDELTTGMSNESLNVSLQQTFKFQIVSKSDEYDVFYYPRKNVTLVSVKNCFWPEKCTTSQFLTNLIQKAKY